MKKIILKTLFIISLWTTSFCAVAQQSNIVPKENSLLPSVLLVSPESSFCYEEFTINESRIDSSDFLEAEKAFKRNIDLILKLKLPSEIVSFFKTVDLVFVRKSAHSFRGKYDPQNDSISFNIAPFVSDLITNWKFDIAKNTTLLDQLLHAYYQNVFLLDPNNSISIFFQDAKKKHSYYNLLGKKPNLDEETFFAHTALTYLCDWSYHRYPYHRSEIKTEQPDYYEYLEQLFGPTHYSIK